MSKSSEYHKLYSTARWKRLRLAQLALQPLCRMDLEMSRIVPGEVVDHIKPHKGDMTLFFDPSNLQTLCKACHDGHKRAQEMSSDGLLRGAGLGGEPLDLAHPWYGGGAV